VARRPVYLQALKWACWQCFWLDLVSFLVQISARTQAITKEVHHVCDVGRGKDGTLWHPSMYIPWRRHSTFDRYIALARTAQKTSSFIACSLISGETSPQSCSLATAIVLSTVYTAVTWQWVYMSQHINKHNSWPGARCRLRYKVCWAIVLRDIGVEMISLISAFKSMKHRVQKNVLCYFEFRPHRKGWSFSPREN
jgi:hypothetical protein